MSAVFLRAPFEQWGKATDADSEPVFIYKIWGGVGGPRHMNGQQMLVAWRRPDGRYWADAYRKPFRLNSVEQAQTIGSGPLDSDKADALLKAAKRALLKTHYPEEPCHSIYLDGFHAEAWVEGGNTGHAYGPNSYLDSEPAQIHKLAMDILFTVVDQAPVKQ
ncbi:hypothetical protein KSF73_06235 [Burkholderiaceae bacterium DAT-1]|nr:hypothetical protein [Burkholderiaceae bacterium DAT-1]